jgi:hypothetical protein
MAANLTLPRHHAWEDWVMMAVGFLIVMSPWIGGATNVGAVEINSIIVGFLIFGIAALELSHWERWEEWVNFVAGLWMMGAPWLLGYTEHGDVTILHLALGALTAAMAAVELWQDRSPAPGTA